MKRLLIFVALAGLLSPGAESFKVSEKEYENIDRMLEFGVQVFLNCLDKVKETTEKLVADDMIRTNRIAIQNHWSSFKETANTISVEERGKGVQDDLVVVARTVRRLVLFYKDDVKNMILSFATEKNVQLYQPVLNLFKGTIERAKVNEVWGSLSTNYFPDAPSIQSEPMEFLCYLLSTNVMETIIVNVLKTGVELISEIKKINFQQLSERVSTHLNNFFKKYEEIERNEREKENDAFILHVSSLVKTAVFYWDRFLNSTDTPLLKEQYDEIVRKFEDQNVEETLHELLKPIVESETVNDVLRLHFEFYNEYYQVVGWMAVRFIFLGSERTLRTLRFFEFDEKYVIRLTAWSPLRTVFMTTVVNSYPIYERLGEMGVFSTMKKLYLRGLDVAVALAGTEEFQTFREEYYEKWKSFREELNSLADEERKDANNLFPQVRASIRMFLNRTEALVNKINTEIDDDTLRSLSMNRDIIRRACIQKLLDNGVLTQAELDDAERIFYNDLWAFFDNYLRLAQGMDNKKAEDTIMALVKVVLVGLNFIYASMTQTWDFIAI